LRFSFKNKNKKGKRKSPQNSLREYFLLPFYFTRTLLTSLNIF